MAFLLSQKLVQSGQINVSKLSYDAAVMRQQRFSTVQVWAYNQKGNNHVGNRDRVKLLRSRSNVRENSGRNY